MNDENQPSPDEIQAEEFGRKCLDLAIESGITMHVAQAALSSAWLTICRAVNASPAHVKTMTDEMAEFYKQHLQEFPHAGKPAE